MSLIFDIIRKIKGRPLLQAEVNEINAAMEGRRVPDSPDPHHAPDGIGPQGVALIKQFEGCAEKLPDGRIQAYPDPGTGGKPWTIGWGSTTDATGRPINPGTVWTQLECDNQLARDLAGFARDVAKATQGAPTTQAQFDAMVSFHYNTGKLPFSTLLRKHRAGDYAGAAAEFGRWVNAGGRPMQGLVRRRAAEAALYRGQA